MRKIAAVAAAAGLAAGLAATSAQADDGWYATFEGGASMATDADVTSTNVAGGGSTADTVEFDIGYSVLGAVGYRTGPVRMEAELSWRSSHLDKIGANDGAGFIEAASVMANVLFDIETGSEITPYIGGGIGYARAIGRNLADRFDTADNVVAYQGIAGVAFAVAPDVSLNVNYRYFGVTDPEFEEQGGTIDAEYASHNLMVGFTKFF